MDMGLLPKFRLTFTEVFPMPGPHVQREPEQSVQIYHGFSERRAVQQAMWWVHRHRSPAYVYQRIDPWGEEVFRASTAPTSLGERQIMSVLPKGYGAPKFGVTVLR